MPKRIQTVPGGLLSLLAINDNQGPIDLSDTVVPIIDITPRYNARLLSTQTEGPTAGLVALGATVTLTVPNGENWDIVGANFTAALLAGGLRPALELNINGCAVAFVGNDDVVRANPYEETVSYVPQGGLVLSPGHTINGIIRSTPNSAITGIVRALIRSTRV